jgi:hypothetical protein
MISARILGMDAKRPDIAIGSLTVTFLDRGRRRARSGLHFRLKAPV